jgi:hypothetical protein
MLVIVIWFFSSSCGKFLLPHFYLSLLFVSSFISCVHSSALSSFFSFFLSFCWYGSWYSYKNQVTLYVEKNETSSDSHTLSVFLFHIYTHIHSHSLSISCTPINTQFHSLPSFCPLSLSQTHTHTLCLSLALYFLLQ